MASLDATKTVPIIIKSPNNSPDFKIEHAKLGWTIAQLKCHITVVHPTKPTLEEQKLVYCGRLLDDELHLKDVLCDYQSGKTEFLHLVVSGKALSRECSGSTGLRQRKPQSSPVSHLAPPPLTPHTPNNTAYHQPSNFNTTDPHNVTTDTYASQFPVTPPNPTGTPMTPMTMTPLSPQQQYYAYTYATQAQQYFVYAQQLAQAGYPHEYVSHYSEYASYFHSMATIIQGQATPQSTPQSSQPQPQLPPSPFYNTEHPVANDGNENVANNEDGHQPGLPDDHRFAHAGHGAQPAFVDREDPVVVVAADGAADGDGDGVPLRRRILDQLALLLKLAFFMFYFGAHATGWRYATLILLCFVTFLVQGGWLVITRTPAPAPAPAPVAVPVPVPPVAAAVQNDDNNNNTNNDNNNNNRNNYDNNSTNTNDSSSNNNNNSNNDDSTNVNSSDSNTSNNSADGNTNANRGLATQSDDELNNGVGVGADGVGADGDGVERIANPDTHHHIAPPPTTDHLVPIEPPPTLPQLVGNIVLKFFSSMVPGQGQGAHAPIP